MKFVVAIELIWKLAKFAELAMNTNPKDCSRKWTAAKHLNWMQQENKFKKRRIWIVQ